MAISPNNTYADITILKDTLACVRVIQSTHTKSSLIIIKPSESGDILSGKTAFATTSSNFNRPSATNQTNISNITWWAPVPADSSVTPQWLVYDLGNSYSIDRMVIKWNTTSNGYGTPQLPTNGFKIQVSNGNITIDPNSILYYPTKTEQTTTVGPGANSPQYLKTSVSERIENIDEFQWTTIYEESSKLNDLPTVDNKFQTQEISFDQMKQFIQQYGGNNIGRYVRILFPIHSSPYGITRLAAYGKQQACSMDRFSLSGNDLTLKVSNNSSIALENKKILVATYNDNVLESFKDQVVSLEASEKEKLIVFHLDGTLADKNLKMFIWDSLESMMPLTNMTEYHVSE